MDIWKMLELEPTTDKDLIKKAYMEKLNKYHPEEDQEGFQMLRASYEEALKYKEEDSIDDSLEGEFLRDLKELYNDFERRIDLSNWQDLILNSDYIRIDTEDTIIDKTLEFFMDNYFLPKDVWVFLIEAFNLKERKKELYKSFNRDFINYILDFEEVDEFIRYKFFDVDPTVNYDELISLCHKLNRSYANYDKDLVDDLVKQIDDFNVYNLDIEIVKCGRLFTTEDYETLAIKLQELNEKYPDDYKLLIEFGFLYLNTKKYKEALDAFKKVLSYYPNNNDALRAISDCYFELGDYVNAKEAYKTCIKISPNNGYIRQKFTETNEKLVSFYEEFLKNNEPYIVNGEELTAFEINYRLAVSYYNVFNFEKCFEILDKIEPDNDSRSKYYDILSDTCLQLDKAQEAYDYIQKWKTISEPKETMFLQEANTLIHLERYDEVICVCDKALELYPNEVEIYFTKMSAYLAEKKYDEVIKVGEEGLGYVKNPLYIYTLLAKAYFEINQFADSMDACNNALNIHPCIADIFIIKLKIFATIENYEQVLEVCKVCESYNIESPEILYYKSFALRDNDNFLEAKEILIDAIELKNDEPKYYYELSRTYFGLELYKSAIEAIEKSISLPPENPFAYVLLAKYLRLDNQTDKSLEYYKIALEKNPDSSSFIYCERGHLYESIGNIELAKKDFIESINISPDLSRAYGNLADIFRDEKNYDKAIEYYTKQLEIVQSPYLYVYRGICYGELGKIEKEIEDYNLAIEVDPSYGWSYSNLGYVYYAEYKDYDKALEYYNMALEKDNTIINPYVYMSIIYTERRQPEKAVELINKALEIFKDVNDQEYFYRRLAKISYDTPNTKKTIELYEKAKELKPDDPNAYVYLNLAISYRDDKRYSESEQLLKKGIELYPDYDHFYEELGLLELVIKKRYKKSIEYFNKCEKLREDKEWIYILLGKAYNKLGKTVQSKQYLVKAIEIYKKYLKEKESCCHYTRLGDCYLEMNLNDLALFNYNKSIEVFGNDCGCERTSCDEAFYGLCLIYIAKNERDKALEYLIKALAINNDIKYQLTYDELTGHEQKSFIDKVFSFFNKEI